MVFFCCLNGGEAVVGFIAAVRGSGFKKASDGTAHGGTIVNDKDSGPAFGGHSVSELTVHSHVSRSLIWCPTRKAAKQAFVSHSQDLRFRSTLANRRFNS